MSKPTLPDILQNKLPDLPAPELPTAALAKSALPFWRRFVNDAYALLSSMALAVSLLVTLIVMCLLGTFLPQEALVSRFQIQDTFGNAYPMMAALGLFNVFNAPWFLALQVLFFFNVLVGSFRWLRPAVHSVILHDTMDVQQIQACLGAHPQPLLTLNDVSAFSNDWKNQWQERLQTWLSQKQYRCHFKVEQDQLQVYAHKGDWGRLGPVVAHIGILTVLIASLVGAFTSVQLRHVAKPGESFFLAAADETFTGLPEPYWQGRIPSWQVVVDGFSIQYDPRFPSTAKQYTTRLHILSPSGRELARGETSVNKPFTYDDITFYQASYAPTQKLFFKLNGKPLAVEATDSLAGRAMARLKLAEQTAMVFPYYRLADLVRVDHVQVLFPPAARDKNKAPKALSLEAEAPAKSFAGQTLQFLGPEYATGLQLKKAPELPLMLVGFALITLGVLLSLQPQRRLWLALQQTSNDGLQLWCYHRTNKQKSRFTEELALLKASFLSMPKGVSS